jgi:hypothetical protein
MMNDIAILVASQLQVVNIHANSIQLPTKETILTHIRWLEFYQPCFSHQNDEWYPQVSRKKGLAFQALKLAATTKLGQEAAAAILHDRIVRVLSGWP